MSSTKDVVSIPFVGRHLEQIQLSPQTQTWHTDDGMYALERAGPARTYWARGGILACAGLVILGPGMAEAWMFCGSMTARQGSGLLRSLIRDWMAVMHKDDIRRVQVHVEDGQAKASKMLETFARQGLWQKAWRPYAWRYECRCERYGPFDLPYHQYALLRMKEGA